MDNFSVEYFLDKFKQDFGDKFNVKTIGKSVLGKNIYGAFVRAGKNLPWVLLVGGMHAREHLSADLVIRLTKDYLKNFGKYNYNLAVVPLSNPDGAELCLHGLVGVSALNKKRLIKINGGDNFLLYKANARGVDINNNFDANWHTQFSKKTTPSSQGYYGKKPFSEPETRAIKRETQKLKPSLVISYHLKGEEIYFDFFQPLKTYARDRKVAEIFANATGYKIVPSQNVSSGGYKDWCVQKLGITALTIELGSDRFVHPYPQEEIENIYDKNSCTLKAIEAALRIIIDKPTRIC
jgi:g-D-glutamyl-meso-diaminopimelate peptidase